jgi:putative membrane protein (TIGR04086 family)
MRGAVRWPAVGRGVVVAAFICVPAGLAQQPLRGTNWSFGLFLVIVAGLAAGGFVAGRAGPELALTHGALAGLITYVAVQGVGIGLRLAQGEALTWSSIPLLAILSTGCGVLGGFLADQAERRAGARAAEAADADATGRTPDDRTDRTATEEGEP